MMPEVLLIYALIISQFTTLPFQDTIDSDECSGTQNVV